MSVIVEQGGRSYLRAMASTLVRLLAALALALMPGSMTGAPAMASPPPAVGGHCDEHRDPASAPDQQQAHCTACAAMPAVDSRAAPVEFTASARPDVPARKVLTGILLEIATPPPRAA